MKHIGKKAALAISIATFCLCTSINVPSFNVKPFVIGVPIIAGTSTNPGYTPSQIRTAYGMSGITQTGAGQTIALIENYGDSTLIPDIKTFDDTYGLPTPTLTVDDMRSSDSGVADSKWGLETAMDVETAHVMAPSASLLVVYAASNDTNLINAVKDAVSNGATEVSMSWGCTEDISETDYDSTFSNKNVLFFASTGDSGSNSSSGTEWPSTAPNVIAVGGTTLNLDGSGNRISETAWSGSGGGVSPIEKEPSWQKSFSSKLSATNRVVPDVAFDADPDTGITVYQNGLWYKVAGTSLGAPAWAGIAADVNQTNKLITGPASLYAVSSAFNDIISGSNGNYTAGVGYDAVTGLGSPIVNTLLSLLAAQPAQTTPSIAVTSAAGATTVGNGFYLQMSSTDSSATWGVVSGTGSATISKSGLLTGTGVGTVTVNSTDGATVGSMIVNVISGVEIDVAVTNNSKVKTAVGGLSCQVHDSGDNNISNSIAVNSVVNSANNSEIYKITGIGQIGNYYVILSDASGNSEKIKVAVNNLSTAVVKTTAIWDNYASISNTANPTKSGVLGGIAFKADGTTPDVGDTVEAYNNAGTMWSTKTDNNGEYKIYLVPGAYTLVIASDSTSYKNISSKINVVAGQMTGSLIDQKQTVWADNTAHMLGYTAPTISTDSKTIEVTANIGCTVTAYAYTAGTPAKYTLISKPVISTKTGQFALTLTSYPIGETVAIRVTDPALNFYEDDSNIMPYRDMTLTASTTATVATPGTVTFVDSANTKMAACLTSNITSVTVTDSNNNPVTLLLKDNLGNLVSKLSASSSTKSDYSVSSGKITFKAGVLRTAQNYHITVSATGYNSKEVDENIWNSKTTAPAIKGPFSESAGSLAGTTQFTSIGTMTNSYGDEMVYNVTSLAATKILEYVGNVFSGFTNPKILVANANISGVDSTTNKIIDVYEINSTTGAIVAAKRITLSKTQIM